MICATHSPPYILRTTMTTFHFSTMFLTKHALIPNYILRNFSRALQNRKPKFDAIHFEESKKPYAEDITSENQHEKFVSLLVIS